MNTGEKHFEKKDIQTKLKHHLLESYIERWAHVLINASHNRNIESVNYVDCFAGKGIFDDGNDGSPRIAMNSLFKIQKDFKERYSKSFKFNIITIELNKEYHNNLISLRNSSPFPNQIFNYQGKFEEHLDKVIHKTDGSPSLYFIDPFGYTGLPMKKIKSILSKQSHEVLINVMSYSLVRNLSIKSSQKGLCEFFEIDRLTNDLETYIDNVMRTNDLTSNKDILKLEDKIIAFYKKQLRNNFNKEIYVLSKRIWSKINPNIYFHLVFVTTNILGLEKMKEAFVEFEKTKYSIEESYAFQEGIKSLSMNIFDDFFEKNFSYEYKDFLQDLMQNFNNKTISFKELVLYFLENTPLPYKYENEKNTIYNFIKKIEKQDKNFKRTPGQISKLGKNIDSIQVTINLSNEIIDYLVAIDSQEQLSLIFE